MEGKKKTIEMKPQAERQQKLTYEQLNEACAQLYQQNQNYIRQMQEMNAALMSKRLEYLFKVLEYGIHFNEDFVEECVKEISETLHVDENPEGDGE